MTADIRDMDEAFLRRRLRIMGDAFLLGAAALAYAMEDGELPGFTAYMNEADPETQISSTELGLTAANAAMTLMGLADLVTKRVSTLRAMQDERVMRQH